MTLTKVWEAGNHLIGPDKTFKTFPADGHLVHLNPVSVFSGANLPTYMDISYVYYLKKELLPELHEEYDVAYETKVINKWNGRRLYISVTCKCS